MGPQSCPMPGFEERLVADMVDGKLYLALHEDREVSEVLIMTLHEARMMLLWLWILIGEHDGSLDTDRGV